MRRKRIDIGVLPWTRDFRAALSPEDGPAHFNWQARHIPLSSPRRRGPIITGVSHVSLLLPPHRQDTAYGSPPARGRHRGCDAAARAIEPQKQTGADRCDRRRLNKLGLTRLCRLSVTPIWRASAAD